MWRGYNKAAADCKASMLISAMVLAFCAKIISLTTSMCVNLEATPGIEPGCKDLQSSA